MANMEQCNLLSLPPEILIPIMTHLPDLESLDSLIRAAPTAYRLFNEYGGNIYTQILNKSDGLTHKYTLALIRIVSLIVFGTLPPEVHDLDSFKRLVRYETTPHRYKIPEWEPVPLIVSSETSIIILRRMLAIHRKIVCHTVCCLSYFLDKFRPLQPLHLLDKTFDFGYEWDNNNGRIMVTPWQKRPVGISYPVRDVGPPSWIEEQRVLRICWRIELFYQLRFAVNTSLISWPESDVEELNSMDLVNMYDVPITYRQSGLIGQGEFEPDPVMEPYIYQQDKLLEHELIWSVLYYMQENRKTIDGSKFLRAERDWPLCTPKGEHDWAVVDNYTSLTYQCFYHIGGHPWRHDFYAMPLQHVSFKPFRHVGFAIWDKERMIAYGLLDYPNLVKERRNTEWNSIQLAWRSILEDCVLAEVGRLNKEWEAEAESNARDRDLEAPVPTEMERIQTAIEDLELGIMDSESETRFDPNSYLSSFLWNGL